MVENALATIPRWKRVLGLANISSKEQYGAGLTLVIPQWANATLGETAKGYSQAIKFGFSRNELVYACVMASADATASVSLKVYDGRHREIVGHPLRNLLEHPNPRMTEFDFWSLTTIMTKLSGHAFWQVIRSKAGLPVQLWPLRPDWMAPVRRTGGVEVWHYGAPGLPFVEIKDRDVIDFNLMHPNDPIYGGLAPIEVLSRVGDADNATTDFIKGFFESGAMPSGILTSDARLNDADSDYIREGWRKRYAGWRNWVEPAVLGMGASYQRIGFSFQEMGFSTLDERAEARICMVLGVNPIVVGSQVGLKRSIYKNYGEARLAWWEDHLYAMFQHYLDIIQTQLAGEFGSGFSVEWDFTKVPALQDDQAALRQHALAAFSAGLIMQDEARATMGLEPLPNGKGQVFSVPNTVTVTPLDALGAPPPVPTPVISSGQAGAPDDGASPDDGNAPANDLPPGSVEKMLPLPAALKVGKPGNLVERQQREAQLAGVVENYFAHQRASIAEQLTSGA